MPCLAPVSYKKFPRHFLFLQGGIGGGAFLFLLALCWGIIAAGGMARPSLGQEAEDPVTRTYALAMHGTPQLPDNFTHLGYVNPNAPKGGSLRLAATGSFDDLNGFIIKGNPAPGLGLIYNSLTFSSPDEPFTQYGDLAEVIEIPKSRRWVAFELRADARWHDGTPITADDVVWSFYTLRDQGNPSFRTYWAGISEASAQGPRRVVFRFKDGTNAELPLIIGGLTILPKHYWQGRDFSSPSLEPPLGSGPYKIANFEAGRRISYERVEDFWGKDLPLYRGRWNFNTISFDVYLDELVLVEAFKKGEYDLRVENSAKNWATAYEDIGAVKDGHIIRQIFTYNKPGSLQGFTYNLRRPLFQNPKIRQALAYAFDFEWMNKTLFFNAYQRSRSYFEGSELAATGLPEGEELSYLQQWQGRIPNAVFNEAYAPPSSDGSGQDRKNFREALRLLKEAGWNLVDGKLRDQNGQEFRFEILNSAQTSATWERILQPFVQNLQRMGIQATIRNLEQNQYIERLRAFDFDMVIDVVGNSHSPGNEQTSMWGSLAADQPGSSNLAGVKDPAIDEMIAALIAAPDRKSLVLRTRALDRVLQFGYYMLPHWNFNGVRMAYWNKFGLPARGPAYSPPASSDSWWIDPQKQQNLPGGVRAKAP
jgi:microcin C transport system substrate-binding protein